MKKSLIILSLFIILLFTGCVGSGPKDKMEVITGCFISDAIEEEIYNVGKLTLIKLEIIEIEKEEYNSLDSNKFVGWLDKSRFYKLKLELTIDENIVIQELKFKGKFSNMPDSYRFTTYFNGEYDSVSFALDDYEGFTSYCIDINANKTNINWRSLYPIID